MLSAVHVLFVAYQFPPVGGAGVQRVTKLVRYLPLYGITPVVLTVANPSVPVRDESLLREIPSNIRVERVRTLEPGYGVKRALGKGAENRESGAFTRALRFSSRMASGLLFPDPQVLWLPAATRAIAKLSRDTPKIEAAVITAPPFSQLLLAPWIRKTLRAPVIVDYRDEWETTLRAGHEVPAGEMATRLARWLERRIVTRVDAITTATQEFRSALLERVEEADSRRVHFLPNGWDSADLPRQPGRPPQDRFRISYAGTVLRLTSLRSLLGALRILHGERPNLAACIELVVYGRVAPSERAIFEGAERLGVQLRGYVDHRRVLLELTRSHLNLCVLDDVQGADRIYPAKIFELMALKRRTLVIAPEGALTRLARDNEMGDVVSPPDAREIARVLERHVRAWQAGEYEPNVEPTYVNRYDRKALAGELAAIVRRVAAPDQSRDSRARPEGAAPQPHAVA